MNIDRTVLSLVLGAILWIALALILPRFTPIRLIFAIPLGLVVGLAVAIFLSEALAYTPPILGADGKPLPGSIAVMEQVQLGPRKEWVIIRGQDQRKPVLLFVSGGPVGSELGWVERYNPGLEKDFVVAIWEEPGGGKSYPAANFRTIKVQDFVDDGIALTEWLRTRFHQDKIYLVGHSWGSLVSVWMVQQHPEYYRALVNVGQMTNVIENDRYGYYLALDGARKANDTKAIADLEKNGPPPYGQGGVFKYMAYLDSPYGPNTLMANETKHRNYYKEGYPSGFNIPEYGLLDRVYWLLGLVDGVNYVYSPQLDQVDLITQATKLDVPVYLAAGRHDYNAWFELTEKYYAALDAPKKELVWFENSGHDLNFTDADEFMAFMHRVLVENQS